MIKLIGNQPAKRFTPVTRKVMAALVFISLTAWPLESPAVELTIRNEESGGARVALAYRQGDLLVMEGWLRLLPDQMETIDLVGVAAADVYIYVEFDDPRIRQFTDGRWQMIGRVLDDDFSHTQEFVGTRTAPKEPGMREVHFQHIHELYRTEDGRLWFNLNASAG